MVHTTSEVMQGSTSRGQMRRLRIIEAAADLIYEKGPSSVTHRSVAARAKCSLSATTYYFSGLEDLLYQAGKINISRWATRAERVAETVESLSGSIDAEQRTNYVLAATLPEGNALAGHYAQLMDAGSSAPIARAYRTGRSRLNVAVERVLSHLGIKAPAELIIAIVDGAAVSALSEGREVRENARELLVQFFTLLGCESVPGQENK